MESAISRRKFLTGVAAAAGTAVIAGAAGCAPAAGSGDATESAATDKWSWSTPPTPVEESEIVESIEADILVIGAGVAGVTCALRAGELGLDVAIIEKSDTPSGRGGGYMGYQTKAMTKAGIISPSKTEILQRWIRSCGNRVKPEQILLYLDRSSEALDWVDDLSGEELSLIPSMTCYAGELYKEYPGWELAMGKFADKPDGMSDIVYWEWQKALSMGVRFFFDSPAQYLEKDAQGRVTGCVTRTPEGFRRFSGKKGVVLATGDISGDDEMIRAYGDPLGLKAPVKLYTPAGANTGDGHKMGMWAGGKMQSSPICTMYHPNHYVKQCYFYLYVNIEGERFMNEDTYVQAKSLSVLEQPGHDFAWSVFDSKWPQEVPASLQYGGGQFWDNMVRLPGSEWKREIAEGLITQAIKDGMAFSADTLEDLAKKMNVPEEQFLATVSEYNAMVAAGEDTRYHKRAELLTSISKPPYYALKFGPSLLCMPGGLDIDTKLRVLDENAKPIDGLYAIGNCSGGRYAVDYPLVVNGNSHGSAITFGYVVAEEITKA